MVRKAATVPLVTSRSGERVDAGGDQDVVDHRDHHRHRVLRLEAEGDVGGDQQQREDDRQHGAARDLLAEGRPDAGVLEAPRLDAELLDRASRATSRDARPAAVRCVWIWKTFAELGSSRSPGSRPRLGTPASSSVVRTSLDAGGGSASATLSLVPDSKSMPKLSWLVGEARARRRSGSRRRSRRTSGWRRRSRSASRTCRSPAPSEARRARAGRPRPRSAEDGLGEDDGGEQGDDRADAEREGEALDARRSPARRG